MSVIAGGIHCPQAASQKTNQQPVLKVWAGLRWGSEGRAVVASGSSTRRNWSLFTFFNVWTFPLGQRM